ncbi:MAG: hypothetical protein AAGE84_27760 [Cyanobacteria bacterium P01_G01_bin.39]
MSFFQYWLLLLWILVGACLRFTNLELLPPWTDESATMVFSLGNSFYDVPLNQFVTLSTLMEPLQLNPSAGIHDVTQLLLTESTHPPLYFALTHLWLKLFPSVDGLVFLWGARSLSAGLGVLTIPAIFYFARLTSSSLVISQIAAAIMAISPFGIFLGMQARHYTLVILLIIASLSCFVWTFRCLKQGQSIPFWVVVIWIAINALGVAVHYFFVLSLTAMAIAFLPLIWLNWQVLFKPQWRRLYIVALGSLVGCLVWLPSLLAVKDSSPTDWIYASNAAQRWLEPIGRFLLWLMSTTILLPSSLYDFSLPIIIGAGIITLSFWLWYLPQIIRGINWQRQRIDNQSGATALVNYLIAAIALFFGFTYILGMDLTLAGRFQFVYFPVVIVLIAIGLGQIWSQNSSTYSKRLVALFLTISFGSGIVANLNRGYLQNHRPDLAIAQIAEGSTAPIAIVTTYRHHGQTGRMIGLAWGLRNLPQIDSAQFFLARENPEPSEENSGLILSQQLRELTRPLDLWLVNFRGDVELESQNCLPDSQYRGMLGQYKYRLYRCQD